MRKRITIRLREEVARWARRAAADEGVSVSTFIEHLLQRRMRDEYERAYEEWRSDQAMPGIDAANRLSRDEAHERR